MSRIAVLPDLDPATYQRSELHSDSCIWLEKNCYIDIWIEVLHALKLNPIAMLPFTVAIDFEGDQWTFFKPVHSELRDLYGINVQELNVWRPLIEHAVEHLSAGKMISTEADAFWLPDTAGTDYQRQHTKTTIVLADIDVDAQRLGYFHNAGYHVLHGNDFMQTFRLQLPSDPTFMPLFAETIRFDRLTRRAELPLAGMSLQLLKKHFELRPLENPVRRFAHRLIKDQTELHRRGLSFYHAWAFATIRQIGASAELLATLLRWINKLGTPHFLPAIEGFDDVAVLNKTLILKLARAVNTKRTFEMAILEEMENRWMFAMDRVGDGLAKAAT